jgi:putative transposase
MVKTALTQRKTVPDTEVSWANHRLARAISDAGWAEFARLLRYKQAWRSGDVVEADRWYPSTRLCPACGAINTEMTLADRVFTCGCGYCADRDLNAAVNLARWGHQHHLDPRTSKQRGRVTNARRRDGADQHLTRAGETSPKDAGTDVHTPSGLNRRTPEKGGAEHSPELFDTL